MATKMTPDVNIVLMDIDFKTNEVVTENEDGSYTIVINARLSEDGRVQAYKHAMHHIKNADFSKSNVQQIEYAAHDLVIPDTAERIPTRKYIEQIEQIQKRRRQLQRQINKDKKRVDFIREHCDMYRRAEQHYLYGNDL